jgi:hypothetical protein
MTTQTTDPISPEAALTGVLALLADDPATRPDGSERPSAETLLARAGLTSGEIAKVTGQPAETVAARVEEVQGPALWRTLRRQRAAVEAKRAQA